MRCGRHAGFECRETAAGTRAGRRTPSPARTLIRRLVHHDLRARHQILGVVALAQGAIQLHQPAGGKRPRIGLRTRLARDPAAGRGRRGCPVPRKLPSKPSAAAAVKPPLRMQAVPACGCCGDQLVTKPLAQTPPTSQAHHRERPRAAASALRPCSLHRHRLRHPTAAPPARTPVAPAQPQWQIVGTKRPMNSAVVSRSSHSHTPSAAAAPPGLNRTAAAARAHLLHQASAPMTTRSSAPAAVQARSDGLQVVPGVQQGRRHAQFSSVRFSFARLVKPSPGPSPQPRPLAVQRSAHVEQLCGVPGTAQMQGGVLTLQLRGP